MYLLGYDIGSSSVKASIVEVNTGLSIAGAYSPKQEMAIRAVKPGWAEQDPELWWDHLKIATREVLSASGIHPADIKAIGISYQMHGLVCVGKDLRPLRPSIIWCDSRAVSIGAQSFQEIGENKCLDHLLNSPGNFTASKLKWVQLNEPEIYNRIFKIMLPGDYIALKMTGEICTTISGLSEGILWDFQSQSTAEFLLKHYGFSPELLPEIRPAFSRQGQLNSQAARELGLNAGTVVAYRAGDQPNNAFSLNVLEPGEVAATAGTSGVVYGVSDTVRYDPLSRVNTFAHVNYAQDKTRLGVLLCINGTGILNSWIKKTCNFSDYVEMNETAARIKIGSDGLVILPFGNGAERMLGNKDTGSFFGPVDFNTHSREHLARAAQEGIVFAFQYGMEIMKETGMKPAVIRAGNANMFLSRIFRDTLAGVSGAVIELYNTDGAQGAAKGAGIGAGYYRDAKEAFAGLKKLSTIEPDRKNEMAYREAYERWRKRLGQLLTSE